MNCEMARVRRAFTLMELRVVVGIMSFLGLAATNGYNALQRGVAERGAVDAASALLKTAKERALVDRMPTAVYCYNRMIREATADENAIVVGEAVAIRRAGRITRTNGNYLFDEFGDLDKERLVENSDDEDGENVNSGSTENDNLVPIYKMNSRSSNGRSLVSQTTKNVTASNRDALLSSGEVKDIPCYAFVLKNVGTAGEWHVGDAYGLEFAEIQLPHGYIFGSSYHKRPQDKTSAGDYTLMWFDVSLNSGDGSDQGATGSSTIQIYSLRPGKSGELEAQPVATTDKPTEGLH